MTSVDSKPESSTGELDAEHDREVQPVDREEPPRLPFPVVGIGASAGGLEAFVELFGAMPVDSGMAFVLVQHSPPERESKLASLLRPHTTMPVLDIEEGMTLAPNHVYVLRPGPMLSLQNGTLHLAQPAVPRSNVRPIDDFFRSLAEEQRERAICIVMSGMGSSGSEGSRMVSAVGGLCIAQEPESATFPSMPHHLVEQGNADFVLLARDMPEALIQYARHPYARDAFTAHPTEAEAPRIDEILGVVRSRTKRDFSGYKRPTVTRRIRRRMGVHRLQSLEAYTTMLRKSSAEVSTLADDLLIHVTGFFRDPEAWESLRVNAIEPLVARRENHDTIRCWVTACATGEEAYSLAMLIDEVASEAGKTFDVKIFATDMAQRALVHARAGVFAAGIEVDLTPERLERFFLPKDDSGMYRVKSSLRSMVVFAPQNVLQDPPFSRLDLCSCRNMLIYLEAPAQARLLKLLHFSLREEGTLFLGSSETPGGETDSLFEVVDRRWRIYRRAAGTHSSTFDFAPLAHLQDSELDMLPRAAASRLATQWLIDGHLPASVTVDASGNVLFFHGETEPYLQQPRGEPTRDLLTLVRDGLRIATRAALDGAAERNEPVSVPSRLISASDPGLRAWVTAAPLETAKGVSPRFLVSFDQREDARQLDAPFDSGASAPQLHHELERMRQELQRTVTELQMRNEELRASNEEVTSINEELQSTNEELETSKEELQSLNEELIIVNAQLEAKVREHEATTNDLSSLLLSTDIAVVFLDREFRIRRYTPALRELFDLIPSDAGRPLANLARKFVDADLLEDAAVVLQKLVPVEKEVPSHAGRWYLRRALPYRTADNHIDGVVITFIEITQSKIAEQRLAEKARLIELTLDAIIVCDLEYRVTSWNLGAVRQFGWEASEAIGKTLPELLRTDEFGAAEPLLETAVREPTVAEVVAVAKDGHRVHSLCRWGVERGMHGEPRSLLLAMTDMTELHRQREQLVQGEEQFRMLVDGARDFAMVLLDPDGIITAWNVGAERVLGYREKDAIGQSIDLIFTPEDRAAGAPQRERADSIRDGRAEDARWHLRKDRQRFFSNGVMNCLRDRQGNVRGFVKILRDDTARKLAEESFKKAADEAGAANRMKDAFLATLSHELRTPLAAIQLWVHVLRKQKITDEAGRAKAIEAIAQSAQAQNQLIDDLLDTVRIASGSMRVEVTACDLAPMLHTWMEAMRPTAETKGVRLHLEIEGVIGMVATDPDRVQQIVWNLVKNAITFTPSGGQVTLRVHRKANELQLHVTDTGAGIAPEFLPHVFDAFRQGDSSTSRTAGGLGLGLSIVSKLVHLLNGTVRAESEGLGRGSAFFVRLPHAPGARGARRFSSGTMTAIRSTELAGRRVLLVEDTAETREGMVLILESAGALVTAASRAAEAFSSFLSSRPDIIVSDIAMPEEDGVSLLKRIRTHEHNRGIEPVPALAVSALAHENDRARILDAGFDAQLVKPFEADSLLVSVADLLGLVSSSRSDSSEKEP